MGWMVTLPPVLSFEHQAPVLIIFQPLGLFIQFRVLEQRVPAQES